MTVSVRPPGPAGLRVAMALYGDLTHDSRVIREAESLATAGHQVTVACLAASEATVARLAPAVRVLVRQPPGRVVVPGDQSPYYANHESLAHRMVRRVQWLWQYRAGVAAWGRLVADAAGEVDVWHAHDLTGLEAITPCVGHAVQVVYDSHELFLETGSATRLPGPIRLVLRRREAALIRRCAAVVTVNEGIAGELRRRYRPPRVEVVRNCAPLWVQPDPAPDLLRSACGIAAGDPVILFHGALVSGRGIERLVAALGHPGLDAVHVVLLGDGPLGTITEAVSGTAHRGRVHVLPPVPPDALPAWVASADVGAVLQEPLDLNLVLSTPNKLFEAIAVGTPVLASDLPEIRRVVADDPAGPLGELVDPSDEAAIAAALRRLLEPPRSSLAAMRHRCLEASRERLNWPAEATRLVGLYAELNGRRTRPLASPGDAVHS